MEGGGETGKGEPSKTSAEPNKPKPKLQRLNQNNGAMARGQEVKIGSPFGNRLHSFKGQRDLTLGGKTVPERKKFVPNLNVQRQIKKEPDENNSDKREKREKHKNHKHDKHEKKDRNKNRPELIQTMGSVFAEGMGGDGIKRRGNIKSESNSSREQMQRPKLEMRHDMKFDKEDEKERLQALLRDDFIDDLSTGSYVPVQLPMVDTGKIFKEELKTDKDEEDQIKPKLLNKVRSELDSDDDDDPAVVVPEPPKPVIETKPDIHKEIDIADLVKTQKGDLLFIQLPDHLPGSVPKKTESDSSERKHCSLANLPEGQIGKLQIRRSGRCQLLVGDQLLDVEMGTKVGFLQDAVSVRVPGEGVEGGMGDVTVLGHVKHRLVITPNWRDLLSKSGMDSDAA